MTAPSSSPNIKVTVAIPTYNRADLLRQTLTGITAQQFPRENYEILVVDNNSQDHTRAVVEEFKDASPAPRYVIERRQGLDFARNRAIYSARGDVIPVFPDGLPEWVREWHAPLAFRSDPGPIDARHSPMGANLAFPRWVFDQLGPFHTALDRSAGKYFSGGDSDMIRRIRLAGLEVWFSPGAAVKHQMPASRTTFRYARRHAFDSARSRVIDRAGQPGAKGYLLGRFFANLAKVVGFSLLAALNALILRLGATKKALVRAWRSCGYLYQIPRSLVGRI
jgi:glycosyltransferase involved in cell wall biosynthesis